jgi:hypothetical protein
VTVFTLRKAEGIVRGEGAQRKPGVGGERRMQVRIAEEDLVGEILTRVGRVIDLSVSRRRNVLRENDRRDEADDTSERGVLADWGRGGFLLMLLGAEASLKIYRPPLVKTDSALALQS